MTSGRETLPTHYGNTTLVHYLLVGSVQYRLVMGAGPELAYAVTVSEWPRTWAETEFLLRRATVELDRAARAAELASRHEALMRTGSQHSGTHAMHERMAQLNRDLEQRHITAARIHRTHAERIRSILEIEARSLQPAFMAAVAETSGADSALLSLFGDRQGEALVVSTDKIAAAAHDLEVTLDEGPARDAVAGRELVAEAGDALEERWPLYGPAAVRLGIRTAAAVALGTQARCLGSLTVFGLQPGDDHNGAGLLGRVADALTHTMLLGDDAETGSTTAGAEDVIPLPLHGDRLAVVHQAVGMVAVECACGVADALAMIRAHAFAQSERVEAVAAQVVSRELRLGSDVLT